MYYAIPSGVTAQAPHTAVNSKATYLARLPGGATHAWHAEEYSSAWHIMVASPTAASALVPHTKAYANVQHFSVASWPGASALALGTAAYSKAKHIAIPLSAAAQVALYTKATYLARLSVAAGHALCTAAYSKAKHVAVLSSVAAQVQHPAHHSAAYVDTWHISMASTPVVAVQAQHTAA